jgi:hypothetical protein
MTLKSLVKISSVVSFSLLSFFSVSPKFIELAVLKITHDSVVVLVLQVLFGLVSAFHGFNLCIELLELVAMLKIGLFS